MRSDVSENTVKVHIRNLLKRYRAWHYANAPGPFGGAGLDFLVCHRGRFLGIEAKRPGKVATPRQKATMAAIVRAGGVAMAVTCDADLRALELWLDESK